MSILDLVFAPSPILKKTAEEVKKIDKSTKEFIHNMYDTMYQNQGVGLAAPQVNQCLRILVMDCSKESEKNNPKVLINPVIKFCSEEVKPYEEGCLSFPGHYFEIKRPSQVKVNFIDINGIEKNELFSSFEAVCVQHEIDHLKGTLFVEYISRLKRQIVIKKMQKYKNNISKLGQ